MALLVRALVAFLLLPGIVGFFVPLAIAGSRPVHSAGAVLLVPGVTLLLWSVREFYVAGRGTLAPWAPPVSLVVTGPYRFSRNPMYVAVVLIVAGWALTFRAASLGWYTVALALGFHLRVVFGEEPLLARLHGQAWTHYRRHVSRWLGSRRL